MERQLAASVWPSLEYETGNLDDGKPLVSMSIHNGGVGPARIRAFELSYEGTPVKDVWGLLTACCGKVYERFPIMTVPVTGRVLPANGDLRFVGLERSPQTEAIWEKLDQARFRVEGKLCYCSALDQCWSVGLSGAEPTPTASCDQAARRPQYR
jgi:hypothetical protein